jgi:hypothetical protein
VEKWLLEHGGTLGREYTNDLRLHFGAGSSTPIGRP